MLSTYDGKKLFLIMQMCMAYMDNYNMLYQLADLRSFTISKLLHNPTMTYIRKMNENKSFCSSCTANDTEGGTDTPVGVCHQVRQAVPQGRRCVQEQVLGEGGFVTLYARVGRPSSSIPGSGSLDSR